MARRGKLLLSGAQGWDSVVTFPSSLQGMDVRRTRARNVLVACLGLLAFAGMSIEFPALMHAMQSGGVAGAKAVPIMLGALLLLIDSASLLLRRPEHGWLFAIAAIALLLGLFWLPSLRLSPWPWFTVAVASAGAVIGFRKGRGDEAAD